MKEVKLAFHPTNGKLKQVFPLQRYHLRTAASAKHQQRANNYKAKLQEAKVRGL